ncbi:MAG: rhomboid family intramembrane serine protease [Elusimicrobia bacterium]|nr:rhomboid family intramembrane serine protease [Elusimicrobiota bacterium]
MRIHHGPIDFGGIPQAVKKLLIVTGGVFVFQSIAPRATIETFGLIPQKVVGELWLWQPFTYLFLHGGIFHLLFNLLVLWMFGKPVEEVWGSRQFLKYYLLCGVGAAFLSVLMTPASPIPIIGASGAIYGVLVAFALLYPDAIIYLYFFIPMKAKHVAILFGAIEFLASASGSTPTIARFAHLGGMLTGYLYLKRGELFRIQWKKRPRSPSPRTDPAREVDRILDKILLQGMSSLTSEERTAMERYSKKRKGAS